MEYKIIRVGELLDYIESEEYNNLDYVPISKHRALSQYHNPRADKYDVALVIAQNNNKLQAYIGALPDLIKGNKVAWLSCWKSYNNSGARQAIPVLKKMIEAYNGNVLFGDMTPTTKGIYQKLKLGNFFVKEGLKAYYLLDLKTALANKFPKSRILKFSAKPIGVLFNLFTYPFRLIWKLKLRNVQYEVIDEINDELNFFVKSKNIENLVQRDGEYLNWINKYPWILESKKENEFNDDRYFFSAFAKSFSCKFIVIHKEEQTKAFIMTQMRDGKLKIPYVFYEQEYLKEVIRIIYAEIVKNNSNELEVFHPDIVEQIKIKRNPFFLTINTERHIGASKNLNLSAMKTYDGDGDVVFT